ncbi:FMR1-interacting protein NUFIP1 [Chironomus tepperi]|uniref:FMR1-interacting protein NUFIP1 n=1 Tax=Chironomus tepperi TaxID=113505 RepID=UPI00391F814B
MTLPSPFATQTPISTLPTQNKQQSNRFQPKGSHNNQGSQHSGQHQSQFQQNSEQNSNQQHPAKRNFIHFCKYCQEGFSTDTELFQHRRSHAKCPYDDCKFNANDATIAIHIQKVHLKQNGLVKIQDLSTPEQIEKWREERRKRYPTTQNVILRQQIQEERQKRGERLNDSKKRFGDGQQRDFVKNLGNRQHDNKRNHNNKQNRNNDRSKKFQKRTDNEKSEKSEVKDPATKPVENVKPEKTENFKSPAVPQVAKKPQVVKKANEDSSDEEETRSVPKFQGTSKMKNYHTVESSVKEKPALSLLGMYGSDSEDENSNASDEEMKEDTGSPVKEALSLEDQNLEPTGSADVEDSYLHPQVDSPQTESIQQEATDSIANDENDDECPEIEEEQQEVDDNNSEPEELPTVKQIEADEPSTSTNPQQRSRKRKRNDDKQEPKKIIRRSGLDYSKLRNRSINPFLEKLLERDIVHERNVLLQCVNFVVKNNFFGIGESAGKSSMEIDDGAEKSSMETEESAVNSQN